MMRDAIILKARSQSVIGYLQSLGINGHYKHGRWICCSPLRGEKTPSFSVTPEKNVWYDFGLGVGGDLINLVERLRGCTFKEAVQLLAGADYTIADDRESAPPPSSTKEVSTAVPPDVGQSKSGRRVVEKYFKAVSLPFYPEIEAFPLSHRGGNYIGFPVTTPAARLGVECRGFDVTVKGVTPCHRRMTLGRKLPWVFMRNPERFLVTESITDSLAGEVILGDNTMSLLALNGVGNVKLLPDYIDGASVLLALDNDGPENDRIGQRMEMEAEKLLLQHGCHVSHVVNHIVAGVKDLFRLLQLENRTS
jgi:hypothetical protein